MIEKGGTQGSERVRSASRMTLDHSQQEQRERSEERAHLGGHKIALFGAISGLDFIDF
jgi:hypothetical protein